MRVRVRGGNLAAKEKHTYTIESDDVDFESEILAVADRIAKHFDLGVTADVDARGANTRISFSMQNNGDPGIQRVRRYG
jgi:hypothetical protein